ncbi:hypothetical protein ACIQGO_12480 [Streptomyces shenzhenensis]|uniref:hypothetical protein n=1 Tax=Streptomyces shenzhenensis TaxID=943815 RepID=UPI00381C1AA1
MSGIPVIGGTGRTGARIAAEVVARGQDVTSYARSAPAAQDTGVASAHGAAVNTANPIAGQEVVVAGAVTAR